jgi:hypothetical protein
LEESKTALLLPKTGPGFAPGSLFPQHGGVLITPDFRYLWNLKGEGEIFFPRTSRLRALNPHNEKL